MPTSLTIQGNILVDGVLASWYASALSHDFAHLKMRPIQWFPEAMKWISGNKNGSPSCVYSLQDMINWFLPGGLLSGITMNHIVSEIINCNMENKIKIVFELLCNKWLQNLKLLLLKKAKNKETGRY